MTNAIFLRENEEYCIKITTSFKATANACFFYKGSKTFSIIQIILLLFEGTFKKSEHSKICIWLFLEVALRKKDSPLRWAIPLKTFHRHLTLQDYMPPRQDSI